MTDSRELFERGADIREEMLGSAHGRAKLANVTDFTREFEDLVTRYCFAEVWGREGFPRAQRSLITIAMLVAMGRANELRTHVQGAIKNGATADDIKEVLLTCMIYCGVPAALEGFRNASEVLAELEVS